MSLINIEVYGGLHRTAYNVLNNLISLITYFTVIVNICQLIKNVIPLTTFLIIVTRLEQKIKDYMARSGLNVFILAVKNNS